MRAPRQGGDVLTIGTVAGASTKKYPLAPVAQNISYETVSDQSEAYPNQPVSWPLSFHAGFGEGIYHPERSPGYVYNTGVTVEHPNVIGPVAAVSAIELQDGAANTNDAAPMYYFETVVNDAGADDGKPVLYIISVESAETSINKISLDSANFGTRLNSKSWTVNSTQPSGRPALWNDGTNTYWRVPMGDNGVIESLTSIVSSTSADTWSGGTDADARHLCVVGNKLYRTTGANEVSILSRATDPESEANWGDDFYVGEVSYNITDIAEAGGLSYIAKETGFFEWDGEGDADNVLPYLYAPRNGQGMCYWHGGFVIPCKSGLYWTRTGAPIGPDSNPHNHSNHPGLGLVETGKHGTWAGCWNAEKYLYAVYTANTVGSIILRGRERDSDIDPPGPPLVWHVVSSVMADANEYHGCYVAQRGELFGANKTRPSLWFPTAEGAGSDNAGYVELDLDSGPLSYRGHIDVEAVAQVCYSGEFDFGYSRVLKQLRVIDGWAEDFAASGHSVTMEIVLDGATQATVGSAITSDGYFERFWVQDTNDTARFLQVGVSWDHSSNLTNTNGPRLMNVMVRGVLLPDTTNVWTFLVHAEEGTSRTAKLIRTEIEGYKNDLLKYELPDGDSFNGVLTGIRMLRANEIRELVVDKDQPLPKYIMAVTVRELVSS